MAGAGTAHVEQPVGASPRWPVPPATWWAVRAATAAASRSVPAAARAVRTTTTAAVAARTPVRRTAGGQPATPARARLGPAARRTPATQEEAEPCGCRACVGWRRRRGNPAPVDGGRLI